MRSLHSVEMCRFGEDTARHGGLLHPMKQDIRVGDDIEVFYRMRRRLGGDGGFIYITAADRGILSPRVGLSDGWIPARVCHLHDQMVEVEYPYRCHFVDREGNSPDESIPLRERLPLWQIRSTSKEQPLLTILVVRWGGVSGINPEECSDIEAGFWGSSGTSVCDNYINMFTDTIEKCLETNFEIITAFVQCENDLDALSISARFIVASMSGKHRAAMYFLWPVMFQEGATGVPGMVQEVGLFRTMTRFEGGGLSTRFPHPSHLYRCLVSKQWSAHLCLSERYRIPATTRVNIADVRGCDVSVCAATAMEALNAIKRSQIKGKLEKDRVNIVKGVVKLGYSWEAQDVLAFEGQEQLAQRLVTLCTQPGCLADVVYVQEFVSARCEVRNYIINSSVMHRRYTRPGSVSATTARFEGFQDLSRTEAVKQWFDDDEELLAAAERMMDTLINRWLLWLRCECAQVQPVIRLDFFVSVLESSAGGKRTCSVYTGEITELGGSTLNWAQGPELIHRAVLAACLEGDAVPPDSRAVLQHYQFTPRHMRFVEEDMLEGDTRRTGSPISREPVISESCGHDAEIERVGGHSIDVMESKRPSKRRKTE